VYTRLKHLMWALVMLMVTMLALLLGTSLSLWLLAIPEIGLFADIPPLPWAGLLVAGSLLGSLLLLLMSPLLLRTVFAVSLVDSRVARERWALGLLARCARQLDIPVPALGMTDKSEFEAFTVGFSRASSCIVLSRGLLDTLTQGELEAVLAHELVHIRQGDMRTLGIMQGIIYLLCGLPADIASRLIERGLLRRRHCGVIHRLVHLLCQLLFAWPASLWVAWYSRRQEFAADAYGMQLVGRGKMVSALSRLNIGQAQTSAPEFLLAFGQPGNLWHRLGRLFDSHPSLLERLSALSDRI